MARIDEVILAVDVIDVDVIVVVIPVGRPGFWSIGNNSRRN